MGNDTTPTEHYLIIVQGVKPKTHDTIDAEIRRASYAWWHGLNNVWMICVQPGVFGTWADWLNRLVQKDNGRCLILDLAHRRNAHGFLDAEAWNWMREHLKIPQ